MDWFKGFSPTVKKKRPFTRGLLPLLFSFLAITNINHNCVGGEETGISGLGGPVNGVAHTCCPLQDSFKDYSCDSVQPSSEFDMNFHQALWTVPRMLRGEGEETEGFTLALDTRNPSKLCRGILRIHRNFSEHSEVRSPSQLNANETSSSSSVSSVLPKFFANGSMRFGPKLYSRAEYCFDRLFEKGEHSELELVLFDNRDGCVKQVLEISSPSYYRHQPRPSWIKEVFAAVAGLSCLFSIIDVIIYLSLRKYLNVSGWTEFGYFLALVIFSALSIPALLWPSKSGGEAGGEFCYIISVLLQFFQIVTYTSYLMIAFDVYWMLRKSTAMGSYGDDDTVVESKLRLVIYYFLLLSVPLGVVTYGLVLNHGYVGALYDGDGLIPHYGRKSCFSPQWLVSEYLNYALESLTFLVILLSVNHLFGKISRSADVEDAPRVSLLSNMFFFTLVYWIVDLLQFARPLFTNYSYEKEEDSSKNGAETFWIVLEGFGYAQGILAFIVFVFNRKTLRAFRKKSGSDGTLREIFRHACCGSATGVKHEYRGGQEEDLTPMSPLMKTTSLRRSTVRRSHLY